MGLTGQVHSRLFWEKISLITLEIPSNLILPLLNLEQVRSYPKAISIVGHKELYLIVQSVLENKTQNIEVKRQKAVRVARLDFVQRDASGAVATLCGVTKCHGDSFVKSKLCFMMLCVLTSMSISSHYN